MCMVGELQIFHDDFQLQVREEVSRDGGWKT